jgi:hypothetical protein
MKRTSYIILSAVLSLLVHAMFLAVADRILFNTFVPPPPEAERPPVRVSVTNVADLVLNKPPIRQKLVDEAQKRLRDAAVSGPQVEQVLEKQEMAIGAPESKVRLKGLGDSLLKPNLADPPRAAMPSAPPPKIIEIDGDTLAPDRLAFERPVQAKVARFDLPQANLPSLLPPGPLQGGIGDTFDISMRLGTLPGMPGLRPSDVAGLEDRLGDVGKTFGPRSGGPGPDDLAAADALTRNPLGQDLDMLDAFVTVSVVVCRDPAGGGYFRADIAPNRRSDSLPDVTKDVLLVIDHSTSISGSKLEQFKEGTIAALQCLNPKDRFDVVAFTDQPARCFGTLQPVSADTLRTAREYVAGLIRGGMTDVFGSMAPFVAGSNPDPGRPLNIFLMSDGNSTVNIREDDDFVRGIVGMNPGNVSIYSFSAGKKANLFLLQFLGYLNRGFSLHEEELRDFRAGLVRYLSAHSSLLVADLRYRARGGLEADIFPKRLPHLYRSETLSIFGRYPASVDELTLSLLGRDGAGKQRELVFRRTFSECPEVGRELPQNWGAQKIFHLIGQRTLTTDAGVRTQCTDEIGRLAKSYGLFVPY